MIRLENEQVVIRLDFDFGNTLRFFSSFLSNITCRSIAFVMSRERFHPLWVCVCVCVCVYSG